ncbi:MAG: hypothetical protein PUF12_08075 [Thermoflexaceae bacterium]|nr:hypothetical protein [Thermoflexaceae bacterium]
MKKMIYLIKKTGLLAYFPIINVYILIPLFESGLMKLGYRFKDAILIAADLFIPISSVIWIVILLKKYIDDKGNEVFYLSQRIKWKEIFSLSSVYICMITPIYLAYYVILNDLSGVFIYVKCLILIYFFGAGAYFFSYCFSNTFVAFALLLLYTGYSVSGRLKHFYLAEWLDFKWLKYNHISYFYYLDMDFLIQVLPYIMLTIIFYVLGTVLNEHFNKYHV